MTTDATVDPLCAGLSFLADQEAEFAYRNWCGRTSRRRVRPIALWFGPLKGRDGLARYGSE